MPLVELVFMSSFVNEYGHDLVKQIESSSIGKNGGEVKCMTLFSHGNMLQLLQGEASAVALMFYIFPQQTNQFQVIKMSEEVIDTMSLNQSCIGLDKTAFNAHADETNGISVFKLNSEEIGQRIRNGAGRTLSMNFVEFHT